LEGRLCDHEGFKKDKEDWSQTEVKDDGIPTLVEAVPRFKDNV
jgi:hypothetical protein